MKLETFITACFSIFQRCVSVELFAIAIGNILISTVVLPTCYKYSIDSFVAQDINVGFQLLFTWLLLSMVNKLYRRYIHEPVQKEFDIDVDINSEIYINNILLNLDYSANRDINSNRSIDQKLQRTKWNISNLVSDITSTALSLCELLGYTIWIAKIAPLSLITYAIALFALSNIKREKDMTVDKKMEKYDNYWFYKSIFTNNNVHGKGFETMKKINEASKICVQMRAKQFNFTNILTMWISISFYTVMIVNCYLFGYSMTVASIITYVQYCSALNRSVFNCFRVYQTYDKHQREYIEFVELMSKYREINNVQQIIPLTSIVIEYLTFSYSSGFTLIIDKQMSINAGNITLISGNSGHGKSTFFDIIGGYKHDDEYNGTFYVDGCRINGFECLCESRVYTEQKNYLFDGKSVLELVTNDIMSIANEVDMDIVWKALKMAHCDFVTAENIQNSKPKFSGGEEGRVMIARTIYNIMLTKPKIVLLDEIDKAVQPHTMVKIMDNIFKYFKEQKIFAFVIAHSSEMQEEAKYDNIYTFTNGHIC